MIWKAIGQSVTGTSHTQGDKGCEDAVCYTTLPLSDEEALIGFVSDGAGSARFAALASATAVEQAVALARQWITGDVLIDESRLLQLAESIYDTLNRLATECEAPLNEFSCTLLGYILLPGRSCFLQIGDGAIVRNDGSGHYTHLWWPHNGEYQNTTAFLIDDPAFGNLKVKVMEEGVAEVALFTDGLQMLALNNEQESVHQPFFRDLFKWLRMAANAGQVQILDQKLAAYLAGEAINRRTDDDKTLLLATRLKHDGAGI